MTEIPLDFTTKHADLQKLCLMNSSVQIGLIFSRAWNIFMNIPLTDISKQLIYERLVDKICFHNTHTAYCLEREHDKKVVLSEIVSLSDRKYLEHLQSISSEQCLLVVINSAVVIVANCKKNNIKTPFKDFSFGNIGNQGELITVKTPQRFPTCSNFSLGIIGDQSEDIFN